MQEFEQGPRMAVSFFASLLPDREHSSPMDKDFQMLLLERETAACLHHLEGFGGKKVCSQLKVGK